MQLPAYFLSAPPAQYDAATIAAFDKLFAEIMEHGSGATIDYALPYPKWQFLTYLCDQKNIVLHGTGDAEITEFEPRRAHDVIEFGNRSAVYAASDGIWPMYFAIVDRRYVTSLVNGCFRVVATDTVSGPYYFFSINSDALPRAPWREGTIYLLPGDTFEAQPRIPFGDITIETTQRASLVPIRPLAKLAVTPADFPFLAQIHPHDPALLNERAQADPEGFPWMPELETTR